MKSYRICIFLLLLLLLVSCNPAPSASILSLEEGWVRAMPPGMQMTAAYGTITNHGNSTVEITSFSSDSFAAVSLHLTTVENGVSKMQELPGLTQSAGTSSVLQPGGLHLMLMKPTREIHPGGMVGLTLVTNGGEQYRFSLPVAAR